MTNAVEWFSVKSSKTVKHDENENNEDKACFRFHSKSILPEVWLKSILRRL